jgi:phosphonate transport system substrate-binding protein
MEEVGVTACMAALQGLGKADRGQEVLRLLFLDAVVPADPALFDGIAARMAALAGG